jgi:hypothetical protein
MFANAKQFYMNFLKLRHKRKPNIEDRIANKVKDLGLSDKTRTWSDAMKGNVIVNPIHLIILLQRATNTPGCTIPEVVTECSYRKFILKPNLWTDVLKGHIMCPPKKLKVLLSKISGIKK